MKENNLQAMYIAKIGEAVARLDSVDYFLADYETRSNIPHLEAAMLQTRKALECIAFAAIAPDKKQYEKFRKESEKNSDFTKDYNASKIFHALSLINPDFYPKPLLPAQRQTDGSWHFDNKKSGTLAKERFKRIYDQLGKHLHAHNPWGLDKSMQNLAKELPTVIKETRALIQLHARFIRTSDFNGVWIIDASTSAPCVLTGAAKGPYIIQD